MTSAQPHVLGRDRAKPNCTEMPVGETRAPSMPSFSGNRGLAIEEPLIFEIGRSDTTGIDLPEPAHVTSRVGELARTEPIGLPGLSEPETMRHFVRLSQKN